MSCSHLVSCIWDFLLEVGRSLLVRDYAWVDWNDTSLDHVVEALLEEIQRNCVADGAYSISADDRLGDWTAFFFFSHLKSTESCLSFLWFFIHWKTTKWRFWLFLFLVHLKASERWFLFRFCIFWLITHFEWSKWPSLFLPKRRSFFPRCLSRTLVHFICSKAWSAWLLNNIFLLDLFYRWFITCKRCIYCITCFYLLLVIICLHGSLNEMFHGFLQAWV